MTCIKSTQNPATAENKIWLHIQVRFFTSLWFRVWTAQNPNGVDSGSPDLWPSMLSKCCFPWMLRFGAVFYSNLSNDNSDADHVKCSRGRYVPKTEAKLKSNSDATIAPLTFQAHVNWEWTSLTGKLGSRCDGGRDCISGSWTKTKSMVRLNWGHVCKVYVGCGMVGALRTKEREAYSCSPLSHQFSLSFHWTKTCGEVIFNYLSFDACSLHQKNSIHAFSL